MTSSKAFLYHCHHVVNGSWHGRLPRCVSCTSPKPHVVNAPALFSSADEISTGLDSTTTYQIVRCMRNVAHLQEVRRSSVIATCRYLSLCTLGCTCDLLMPLNAVTVPRGEQATRTCKAGSDCLSISKQKPACAAVQATVLMSLLQPPPETYNLFDDIMLLSDGASLLRSSLTALLTCC